MRRLDSFPKDGLVWTAGAFGQLTLNPDVPSEHLVNLHLYRHFKSGSTTSAETAFETAKIGVGTLPDTPLGAQWRDGEQSKHTSDLQIGSGTVHFPEPETPAKILRAWEKISAGEFLIPPWALPIPKDAQDAPYIALPATGNLGEQIILPTAEIARAWYLRSTMLTLALLSDPIDEVIKRFFDEDAPIVEGENPINLRDGFGGIDVTTAAALKYSTLFRQRASQIRTAIMAASLRKTSSYLIAMPPVVGEFPVTALGKRINTRSNGRRFIVFRLLGIPAPALDVSVDSIVHYVRQEEETDPVGTPTGQSQGTHYRFKPHGTRPGVHHRTEPNRNFAPVRLDPDLPAFENPPIFATREILSRKRQSASGAPKECDPKESDPPNNLSTGAGKWSGNTGPLRYLSTVTDGHIQRNRPSAMAATFGNVESVIPLLQKKGWKAWTLSNNSRREGVSYTARYTLPDSIASNSWAYVGHHRRQLLVIEFETEGDYFYLFDIERRPPPAHEHYALYFATQFGADLSPFSRLTFPQIESLIERGCLQTKCGVWRKVDGYQSAKLLHTHSTAEQLATKLVTCIREFRGLAKDAQAVASSEHKAMNCD